MKQKKILLFVLITGFIFTALSAYNPPPNGENMYELVSPQMVSSGSSVTGGGLKTVTPESIVLNPALIAGEQRWVVDLSYTGVIGTNLLAGYGQTANIGLIIPSRFGVTGLTMQGIFTGGLPMMNLGNSFTLRGAFAKDLTDELYVGAGAALAFGTGMDWALYADLGFWYNIKSIKGLGFLKDARWGASITGMGKPLSSGGTGIDSSQDSGSFPGMFTPHLGIAGNLFALKYFSGGIAMDLSFPTFQNVVYNAGLSFLIANIVQIQTGWEFNLREVLTGHMVQIPTVGISVKFGINAKDTEFMSKRGWQQSEIITSGAYQNLYSDMHVASAGAAIYLGQRDTEAPVVNLWGDE